MWFFFSIELLGFNDSEDLDINSGYHYMKMAADHGMDNVIWVFLIHLHDGTFESRQLKICNEG